MKGMRFKLLIRQTFPRNKFPEEAILLPLPFSYKLSRWSWSKALSGERQVGRGPSSLLVQAGLPREELALGALGGWHH